jgi:small subunit ribosomal protein S16
MRLRRVGAKKQPRYRVVIAEARTPRDGAFVATIGYYDPLTEPATVNIDRDKATDWLTKGAQPSDTVVRLLRGAGIAVDLLPEAPTYQPKAVEPKAEAATPRAARPAAASAPAVAIEPETAVESPPTNSDEDATVVVEPGGTAS